MGHDRSEQGPFWGGVWLLKVRLGLWAQPRGAPTSGEGRGGPEEEKSGGAGRASGKGQGRWRRKDKDGRLSALWPRGGVARKSSHGGQGRRRRRVGRRASGRWACPRAGWGA